MAENNIDYNSYGKHFSDSSFEEKISKFAKKIGLKAVYIALILYYVAMDDNVPLKYRATIYGALGYFILPLDLVPDFFPGGLADDIAVLTTTVMSVKSCVSPTVENKAKNKLKNIFSWYKGENIEIF